jgi:ATP-dependent Clp protease ATP-binding subunit ClpC
MTGVPLHPPGEGRGRAPARAREGAAQEGGQPDEAIKAIIGKAIRRSRSGLKDPKRPMGSFIFVGPSGRR